MKIEVFFFANQTLNEVDWNICIKERKCNIHTHRHAVCLCSCNMQSQKRVVICKEAHAIDYRVIQTM